MCIGYIFLMANHTKTLAYISIVALEIIHAIMIGLGLYLISLGGSQLVTGIVLVCVFGFIALIQNILLCFYWSKLQIAIAVIGIAADFYANTKRIILVSLFYFTIHVAFFFVYAYSIVGLLSMNTFKFTD